MLSQSSKSKDAFFSARTLKFSTVSTLNNGYANVILARYGHYIIKSQTDTGLIVLIFAMIKN